MIIQNIDYLQWPSIMLSIANISSVALFFIGQRFKMLHPKKSKQGTDLIGAYAFFFLFQVIILSNLYAASFSSSIQIPLFVYLVSVFIGFLVGIAYPLTGIKKLSNPDSDKFAIFTTSFGIQTKVKKRPNPKKQGIVLIFDEESKNYAPLYNLVLFNTLLVMVIFIFFLIELFSNF